MSIRRALSLAVVVAGVVLATVPGGVLAAQQSAAHRGHAPDAAIRFFGAKSSYGLYRDPGAWQETLREPLAGAAPRGAQYLFQLKVRNPGPARHFVINVGGKGSWAVSYFAGKTNITAAVAAGTYETPRLRHGKAFVITIKALLGRPGTSLTRLISVSPANRPNSSDSVRLEIAYDRCGC